MFLFPSIYQLRCLTADSAKAARALPAPSARGLIKTSSSVNELVRASVVTVTVNPRVLTWPAQPQSNQIKANRHP